MAGITIGFDRTPGMSRATRDAAVRALGDVAEDCLREANRTVPLEEGTLARSGSVQVDPGSMRAAVGYDTPYAVPVHEDPTARHDPGRRHHWLELTVKENQARYQRFLSEALRQALR